MKTALIIIDIQNDYFEGGTMKLFNSEKTAENAKSILDKFRNEGSCIIHIQHIALNSTAIFFLPNTKGAEIHNILKPRLAEKTIIKHFPNSFRETELLDYLKSNKIENLVICGMMTHMCVDATTRAAKDLDFNCTLIGDACTTKDLEINGETVKAKEVHNSFLAALNYYYSTVLTTKDYLNEIKYKKSLVNA